MTSISRIYSIIPCNVILRNPEEGQTTFIAYLCKKNTFPNVIFSQFNTCRDSTVHIYSFIWELKKFKTTSSISVLTKTGHFAGEVEEATWLRSPFSAFAPSSVRHDWLH